LTGGTRKISYVAANWRSPPSEKMSQPPGLFLAQAWLKAVWNDRYLSIGTG
jgi:hypothetical protein